MENTGLSKYTVSFGVSLALCSVINALLVVLKEKSHAVSAALQKITGYQWLTHVAIVLFLFVFFGWFLAMANRGLGLKLASNRLLGIIVAGVVAGGVIITGFYLIAN